MIEKEDIVKLRSLLHEWVALSDEYAGELRAWSMKASLGRQDILSAARHFDVAARALEAALEKLGAPVEDRQV